MDDPYRTWVEHRPDGSVVVVTEADVVPFDGDTSEVEAECRRRADRMRDFLVESATPR